MDIFLTPEEGKSEATLIRVEKTTHDSKDINDFDFVSPKNSSNSRSKNKIGRVEITVSLHKDSGYQYDIKIKSKKSKKSRKLSVSYSKLSALNQHFNLNHLINRKPELKEPKGQTEQGRADLQNKKMNLKRKKYAKKPKIPKTDCEHLKIPKSSHLQTKNAKIQKNDEQAQNFNLELNEEFARNLGCSKSKFYFG